MAWIQILARNKSCPCRFNHIAIGGLYFREEFCKESDHNYCSGTRKLLKILHNPPTQQRGDRTRASERAPNTGKSGPLKIRKYAILYQHIQHHKSKEWGWKGIFSRKLIGKTKE